MPREAFSNVSPEYANYANPVDEPIESTTPEDEPDDPNVPPMYADGTVPVQRRRTKKKDSGKSEPNPPSVAQTEQSQQQPAQQPAQQSAPQQPAQAVPQQPAPQQQTATSSADEGKHYK